MRAVNAVHSVLPKMRTGARKLVAISSLAGFRGLPRSAAYSASKAALTTFFESIRLDVKDKGVDVTIIQPGFIQDTTHGRTGQQDAVFDGADDAIPLFIKAIEKRKKFAAFPWQLATIVRAGNLCRRGCMIASRAVLVIGNNDHQRPAMPTTVRTSPSTPFIGAIINPATPVSPKAKTARGFCQEAGPSIHAPAFERRHTRKNRVGHACRYARCRHS